ncbi:MAG: hypothetical protein SGI89_01980, partial [bacterium]|nr:hypothetical protein [bacterium]
MKKKLGCKIVLVLSLPIIYYFFFSGFNIKEEFASKTISLSDNPETKSFTNLIYTDTYFGSPLHGNNPSDPRSIENNIENFRDSLHFNSIHVYGYGNLGGGFYDDLSYYRSYISGLMRTVKSAGLKGFWGRNKIEQLSYGQRLIYEVEGGNSGFSYQTRASSATSDSGRSVVHLIPNTSPSSDAKWLCKDIYENMQHGDLINFTQADTLEWHIKPVMRIKTTDFNINSTTPVVTVATYNYKGNRIDSSVIRVNNFRDGSGNYIGNYIENYKFITDDTLKISGSRELTNGLSYGMADNWYGWKDSCKVDFKVWWFGEVEVWFDKMIVDDRFGDLLLNTDTAISHPNERKIIEEVNAFSNIIDSGKGSFYIDELCISQLPCAKRVSQLIKQTNENAKLHFATTNYFNIRSCKDNSIGNREILKAMQSESFNPDIHEIHFQYLPNTLNTSEIDPLIDPDRLKSTEVYNEYLQKKVFGDKSVETGINLVENNWGEYTPSELGSVVYQVEFNRRQRDSFSSETKLIVQPQIHAVTRIGPDGYYNNQREPFNEEIEAQAMISIAHGADGICWFIYHSTPTNFYSHASSEEYFILGLQNHDPPHFSHRHRNMYGQDKWNSVRKMNIKIEHWKPTLDEIHWLSGWSVHKDSASHEYISNIKSIYRNPSSPYAFSSVNEDGTKYWEEGFYNPDNSNDKSKYF